MATGAALETWRRALVGVMRRPGPDLSARQLAILLTVYTGQPPHTVVGLADAFDVPHQAISRAVSALERLGLVRRAAAPRTAGSPSSSAPSRAPCTSATSPS